MTSLLLLAGRLVGVAAGAYLLGSLPVAGLVGRRAGVVPEREGSGNPGASNVARLAGRRAGLAVLAGDAGKGLAAVVIGEALAGPPGGLVALVGAVVGHVWPAGRLSSGGKGVATLLGGAAVLWPLPTLVASACWVAIAAVTRRASAASLTAVVVLAVTVSVAGSLDAGAVVAGLAVVVATRHRSNVVRLLAGTEPVLGGRGGPAEQ